MLRPSACGHLARAVTEDVIASAVGRARLLVVDDDPMIVAALQRELRTFGPTVDGASSVARALALAEAQSYSVFALDLNMPEMDGNALAAQLAALRPEASFILITGQRELDLPRQDEGAFTFIGVVQKPWDSPQLLAMVGRAQAAYEDRSNLRSRTPSLPVSEGAPILVLEGNQADAALIRALLERGDPGSLPVIHATRLAEAELHVRKKEPSAIITDLSLPDARGLDAVVRLRAACPAAPIVVLSGTTDEALAMQAVQEGAQEFLLKSELSPASLLRALRHAASRTQATSALRELAERDALTGLFSRGRFHELLPAALNRAERAKAELSLLYFDLDHFKNINDQFGHAQGDDVLREAAQRIASVLRKNDAVARLGGDEMVALLEETSRAQARVLADRVRAEFERPFAALNLKVFASIGIATYPRDATTANGLLAHADHAMYREKRDGHRAQPEQHRPSQIDPEGGLGFQLDRVLTSGALAVRTKRLYRLCDRTPTLIEAEPVVMEDGEATVDAPTLRRAATREPLLRALHAQVIRGALDHCRQQADGLLVTITDEFCRLSGALEDLETLTRHDHGRLLVGLPQRFVQRDPERANSFIEALLALDIRTVVMDFGALGADIALLSRVFGLHGICLDGALLRELSKEAHRARAFLAVVESIGVSLSLEVLVREEDLPFCTH